MLLVLGTRQGSKSSWSRVSGCARSTAPLGSHAEAGLQSHEPGILPGLETAVGVAGISTRSLPYGFWIEKGHFATICVLG